MIAGLYLTTFIASLIVLCMLLLKHKRTITLAVLFSILVTVNSLGRYLMAVSSTFEMARLGNLLIYVGGCFGPLVIVKILAMLCQVKLPKWVTRTLTVFSCIVFALVLSIGHCGLYYKTCYFVKENGFSYLGRTYGPLHFLFPSLMLIYFCIIGVLLVVAIEKRKEISIRTVGAIACLAFTIITAYVIERVLDTHVSYISIGYLLAMILFMRMIERINMYDLPTNIANSIDEMKEYAYLEFDSKYRVAGYNQRFKELFPEIENKWKIDQKVPMDDSYLYKQVILWMYRRKDGEKKTIQIGDHYYEMFVRQIPYLNKPCVGYMLELADRTGEMKYMSAIKNYNSNLEREVKKKTEHISQIKDMMVVGMASMVESRDDSTGDHIKRTYHVMKVFSKHLEQYKDKLGVSTAFLEMVARAAPMHDLGKIAVDDEVLRKKGKFTPEEYEKMKKHPGEGAKIVREILTGVEDDEFVRIAENVAHYHHEKWNGQGYPTGLRGEFIPMEARLMALADVLDALVSKRCYKDAYSFDKAFEIIDESLGSHFDPVLGKYFMECRPEIEAMYTKWDAGNGDEKVLMLHDLKDITVS